MPFAATDVILALTLLSSRALRLHHAPNINQYTRTTCACTQTMNFSFQISAHLVMSTWLMATLILREDWRCVSMVHGPRFMGTTATGIHMQQMLPAGKCLEVLHVRVLLTGYMNK